MNTRERVNAVLHYQPYDRMPLIHFGYWQELLEKWVAEGHITPDEKDACHDGSPVSNEISARLGFDCCWSTCFSASNSVMPGFPSEILENFPDGSYSCVNCMGLIERVYPGIRSIPMTIGTLLTGREAWEELYKPKLLWSPNRIHQPSLQNLIDRQDSMDTPLGLHVGSYYGTVRDMLGVEELAYLYADDEELYAEIIATLAEISYKNCECILQAGLRPDFAHFWEDICYKNGPLVSPEVFAKYVGPHYKKITALLTSYGCDIVSLDCDGQIDKLVPIWLENGVNTMFPIEVGTWHASIGPWREKYGTALRGIGGLDKRIFAYDYAAADAEIERLKPLIELGGYIPCPDHRLPPETKWENVQYFCEKFRESF